MAARQLCTVIKQQSESKGEREQLMVKQLFQYKALFEALNLIEINLNQKYFLFWSSFLRYVEEKVKHCLLSC